MKAALTQAAGILLVSVGAGLWSLSAGLIVGGIGVLAFGLALERRA